MASTEETAGEKAPEKMITDQEEGSDTEEGLLGGASQEDAASVSSSILNDDDDDEEEDGINVTIRKVDTPKPAIQPNDVDKEEWVELSGFQRRKYSKLRNNGVPRAKALALAQQKAPPSTPKRTRNLNDTNESEDNPNHKRKKGFSPHTSVNTRLGNVRQGIPAATPAQYSEVAQYVRVGILPPDYPQRQLTDKQMQTVQEAILYNVTRQQKELFKPKFSNCWQRHGCLVINCQNIQTAEWLENLVSAMKPWEGAELLAIDANNIPRLEVLIGFFPQSVADDDQAIKTYIESQNDGLFTGNWRIIERRVLFENHVEWLFTVDDASMNHFKDNKFHINYKFGQTNIRKKTSKTDTQNDHENLGTLSEASDCLNQRIHMNPGDKKLSKKQGEQVVPGQSRRHDSKAGETSSKNAQHNKNHSGAVMDQTTKTMVKNSTRAGDPKDRNVSKTTKYPENSKYPDRKRSGEQKNDYLDSKDRSSTENSGSRYRSRSFRGHSSSTSSGAKVDRSSSLSSKHNRSSGHSSGQEYNNHH